MTMVGRPRRRKDVRECFEGLHGERFLAATGLAMTRVAEVTRTALRLNYHLGLLPLRLVEERVLTAMDSASPARLLYERVLGAVHFTVGTALGDPRLRQRGDVLLERGASHIADPG